MPAVFINNNEVPENNFIKSAVFILMNGSRLHVSNGLEQALHKYPLVLY